MQREYHMNSVKRCLDSKKTWHEVQQAWSKGDRQGARTALANLMKNTGTQSADTWRLWGDTAAALQDLRLAALAYEQACHCLPPGQLNRGWFNRCRYARLQATTDHLEIEDEYYDLTSLVKLGHEDRLVGLALEADLCYRRADIPQAAVIGNDLSEQWLGASHTTFEFLDYVQDRIWLMLARLAEESSNIQTARRFLLRLDDSVPPNPDVQPAAQLLRVLLDYQSEVADRADIGTQQIIERLMSALAADLEAIQPPIPPLLLASLHKTLIALQAETGSLSLLENAVKLRHTNMLARRLYVEEMAQQGKRIDHILAAEANLWLTTNPGLYEKSIGHFFTRAADEKAVTFAFVALGGGGGVGGSAYLLDLNGTKLLLDIGLDVATSPVSSYQRLKRGLAQSGIINSLAQLNATIVSHAHLDHIGLLPAMYADSDLIRSKTSSGYRPQMPLYASEPTRELARIMLQDASQVAVTDDKAIYTTDAVAGAMDCLKAPPPNGLLSQFRNLGRVELLDSGHILGSKMILLEKDGFCVLYTGDFNTRSQLTLPASAHLKDLRPDVLIMESTYGYTVDEWTLPRAWQEQAFVAHLDQVLRRGGVVLLPAFAVGRSQEVLGLVAEHTRQYPDLSYSIYLDGLSKAITNCYDRFDSQLTDRYRELRAWISPRLTIVPDDVDREALIHEYILGRPSVVIASSGMLKKGSVSYQYAVHIAQNPKNAIFYTGYLAEDSEAITFLGGTANDLTDTGVDIQCEQRRFHFSAHSPKEDLLQFVVDVQPRAVILVHGDANKSTQVTNNLYMLLRRLESDSFRVFLGRDGRPVTYDKGRFSQ
jgi:Cft2 family RNA processing exonuclease